jgi:hypothetical protein
VLATVGTQAVARRSVLPTRAAPRADLLDLLRERLTGPGTLVLLGRVAGEPVACGMGSPLPPATTAGLPEVRTAELSLLAVTPGR